MNRLHLSSLIVLILSFGMAVAMIKPKEQAGLPMYADITFVNKTGKKVLVRPIPKDIMKTSFPIEIEAADLRDPKKEGHATLKNVNLDEMEMYHIRYPDVARAVTRYMRQPSEINVLAADIEEKLRKEGSHQAEIPIQKINWYIKSFGLAKPEIIVAQPVAHWEEAEEGFITTKEKIAPEEEQKIVYGLLGVSPDATPYQILNIPGYTGGESLKTFGEYAALLASKAEGLLKKYDPDTAEGKARDAKALTDHNISNVSKKMQDIVRAAQHKIAQELKLR